MVNPNNPHALMDVHYFWNGTWATVVHDGEGLPTEQIGWTGKSADDLSDQEIQFMNKIAADKRKKTFTALRTGRHYRVTSRGEFADQ